MIFRVIIGTAVSALFTLACKPTASSQLQHEFGNTRVEPKNMVDCHKTPSPSFAMKSDKYPKTEAYLKQVALHLMKSNGSTFNGAYDPARFCFGIVADPTFNAFANPNFGEVAFHTGAFAKFANDAEVAAIMAHELAHITMQHDGILTHSDMAKVGQQGQDLLNSSSQIANEMGGLIQQLNALSTETFGMMQSIAASSPADQQAVTNIQLLEEILVTNGNLAEISPTQWATYQRQMEGYYTEIMGGHDAENGVAFVYKIGEITRIEAQLDALRQRHFQTETEFQNIAAQKLETPEQIANGREREADEVGYEFYLRAALHPAHFVKALSNTVDQPADSSLQNLPLLFCIKNMLVNMRPVPERGFASHPTGCWRLYNIGVSETNKHQKDYAPYMQNATRTTIPGPVTLAEVRAEIQAAGSPAPPQDPWPHNPPAPDQSEWERLRREANAAKKALCQKMNGQWIEEIDYSYCRLPNLASDAEKKAYCARFNGFWHSDNCACLPLEWQNLNIDPQACVPSGSQTGQYPNNNDPYNFP